MFFDTHAHYDDPAFDDCRYELLDNMPNSGVELILNPGCDRATSEAAIALAERYDYVYAAVGWHPHESESFDSESEALIRSWAQHPKVKAIGEIGLDYHYDTEIKDAQLHVFERQMALAEELGLPVIIHDRDAHADCMSMVERFPAVKGVFHCYSGSAEMARRLLEMGWYLSFTGAITFKNARRAPEVIAACPNDRIMIETDCPYMAPVPHRGERCDSRLLLYMAAKIAEVKGMTAEAAAEMCMENGKRFFNIHK
ncbi:MAG: TatD family hydrolase [Oscillospiraceae bacterium]|nr:TatD family hydrolase [Oscillospiraceae bacterium]